MRMLGGKGLWAGVICAVIVALAASPAQGEAPEPDFVFLASKSARPGGDFEGPCGLAVDSVGNFYVSDYYNHSVDVFSSSLTYRTQLTGVDPLNGPCALDLDPAGHLYVNNFHSNVVAYTPSAFPPASTTTYSAGQAIEVPEASRATGVAVDPAGTSYVNERTYVGAYLPTGEPLEEAGEPLRIGSGSLGNGYGLAFSRFPLTAGRLYVPDASTNTVKVYDPTVDPAIPVATISGPPGGFASLRDSAVAVDRTSGEVYVADAVGSPYTEFPQVTIQIFDYTGGYEGHLKYNVVGGAPSGLAVDNSVASTQGRVYVTSGNTEKSSVYAYPPDSATTTLPICTPVSACPGQGGKSGNSGAGIVEQSASYPAGGQGEGETAQPRATGSVVAQKGALRVDVDGKLAPQRLPRRGAAPISVSVGGKITTTDGSPPSQLKSLRIELNRHGQLDYTGLPTCAFRRIQPASTSRALSACRSALVGRGRFTANISLAGQEPYPTKGHLLVFNGRSHGRPVLLGQIYAPRPFATSFVIVFEIGKIERGAYGTALDASLPKAMGSWGNLTGIEMSLSRRFAYKGVRRSYLSASCPAPNGFRSAPFPLIRTSFGFEGGVSLRSTLDGVCKVKGR